MIKNNYKKLIIGAVAVFFLFLVFNFSFAADSNTISFKYPWSGQTTIPNLVSKLYIWALGLAGGAAFVVLIWGAILYTVSGAVDKKSEAKEWIKGAIYGLILLLGAYLILYTINPNLVNLTNPESLMTPLNFTSPTGLNYDPGTPAGAMTSQYDAIGSNGVPGASLSQSELTLAQVNVKNGVDLSNVRKATIDEVSSLGTALQQPVTTADGVSYNSNSGSVTVTSGDEGNHNSGEYSHANGYKVDLRMNPALDSYIETNFTSIAPRTDKVVDSTGAPVLDASGNQKTVSVPQWQNPATGAIYAQEASAGGGPHWDVLVKPKT